MTSGTEVRRIVAGTDGSEGSLDALRWAASEAELRGAELLVLLAWQPPYTGPYLPAIPLDAGIVEEAAREGLRQALTAVFGDSPPDGVRAEIRQGTAAKVLTDAGKEADLLVVGSRGHGGLVGALLGSVSTAVIHHATCPVLVVRRPADGPGHDERAQG
ncbi:universal stress protein [Frankia sp. CNm7]|uniref:Universal stress protein n=1 Tax=Frankia nepalensis TaxID=1836974 RepID=A0A937RNQ5_9ACTN|nr:universal stress protein [Frankia nepalensis]MBL7495952.1 universal stress protein [Frankia nepalensis]MBL7515131.1 universal stress protein [Frankia nepalensis]MBL7518861.1 universal stress protein [Frankia nepalensis]MBL7629201.1 universal stress protein [Frankia nepalensis]